MKLTTLCFTVLLLIPLGACQPNTQEAQNVPDAEIAPLSWLELPGSPDRAKNKKIVLISGDEEYRSEEMLPQLAKILAEHHGFDCIVLFAQDPARPGIVDPNYLYNIPGLEALAKADLVVLFTRFRALPDEQMQHIQAYIQAGKPIIGLRTATHAFNFTDSTSRWYPWGNYHNDPESAWDGGFGRLVLGERWHTHHGYHKHQSTRGIIAAEHPITRNLDKTPIWGPTDVYGVRIPLPGDALPLVLGQVLNRQGSFSENDVNFGLRPTDNEVATVNPAAEEPYNPNDPPMPIAWTKSYQLPDGERGQSFTSTIGSSTDFANEGVRRLLVNAVYYLLDLEVPQQARVDLVGNYQPSAYSFHDDSYWDEKQLKIADMNP
ncbi:MAG: ThuA domain-containing protein [Cyclobacteriaceae bacterium]|nr:ThuA domain-containing protein [Cyclobacteriaceae bacterium]